MGGVSPKYVTLSQLLDCTSVVSEKAPFTYDIRKGLVRGIHLTRPTIIGALSLPSQGRRRGLRRCENHTRIPSTCPIALTLRP